MSEKISVEYIETERLIPYVNNSRTHSDEQITQICASIKEFGFTNPILIDESEGIIAGHGRVSAAKRLGMDQVPCIRLVGLTKAQRKAYVIADNQLALNAGWDLEKLKLEIEDLKEVDFDIELLGFDEQFVETLNLDDETDEFEQDNSANDEFNYTIQYNIIFDEEEQQEDWYSFVRFLKEKYPDCESIGQRLQIFIRDNGYVAN